MQGNLVPKESLEHNRKFRGFEIWADGKRVFACNDVIVWQMDCMMIARQGENLPVWSDDGADFDCYLLHVNRNGVSVDYLTIGYK